MNRMIAILIIASLARPTAYGSGLIGVDDNRLANGGFESPTVIGGDQEFSAPSTAIPGWHISGGSIDLVTSGTILGTAHSGLQMIDVNGSRAGAIEQTFATVPGNRYQLEAFYSNNPNPASAEPSYAASVRVMGTAELLIALVTHSGATEEDMNWLRFAQEFVADSKTTTLILSGAQGGFNGIYFDTVSVIPEPTCIVGCVSAAASLLLARSRRVRTLRSEMANRTAGKLGA